MTQLHVPHLVEAVQTLDGVETAEAYAGEYGAVSPLILKVAGDCSADEIANTNEVPSGHSVTRLGETDEYIVAQSYGRLDDPDGTKHDIIAVDDDSLTVVVVDPGSNESSDRGAVLTFDRNDIEGYDVDLE